MMRMLSLSALAATALCGVTLAITSATAQTPAPAPGCGVETYSVAEQKYVGVPCAAPVPQTAAGQSAPCGVETYSVAEQKYVGVPCAHQ